MAPLLRPLRDAPRWLFLATLVYAPWAYGCTTAATIVILDWLLAGVLSLWVAEIAYRRELPRISPFLLALIGAILAFGWGMTLNARSVYDPQFHLFSHVAARIGVLPGSYDYPNSVAMMTRCTLLLGAGIFVADLVRRPLWLVRIWATIAGTGGSIALLGLLQKASGSHMIFWEPTDGPILMTFFASYYYHANAGAFLNLVFPLAAGLAARTLIKPHAPGVRALALCASLLLFVAIFANTSRAAEFIGLGLIAVLAVRSFRGARQLARRLEASTTIVALVLTALALFAVAQASHLDQPLSRWAAFHAQLPNEGRVGAVETAWPATHDSGWFGFGPGTFRSIFPHYVDAPGSRTSGVWRFLHEDYLQTILEWGWLGSILWAALFMGAMVVAYRNARRSRGERLSRQRMLLPLVCLGLGSAMLHALVDFPLQIASIELYVATYLGICWGSCCWTTGDEVRADTNAAM